MRDYLALLLLIYTFFKVLLYKDHYLFSTGNVACCDSIDSVTQQEITSFADVLCMD